jgi:hypothetical protein
VLIHSIRIYLLHKIYHEHGGSINLRNIESNVHTHRRKSSLQWEQYTLSVGHVAEGICYKLEGSGFVARWGELILLIYLINPSTHKRPWDLDSL